ncbi:MAG: LacI family DNA-binding transcriptional regulator [Spirochaetes bacterium]|nr:LacI family DNA-binding transcriptional regulator [Spirochaetota bacterium]
MKKRLTIERGGHGHPFQQIKAHIKGLIATGALKPNDAVPSVRDVLRDAKTSIATVQRAFAELKSEGVIYSRRGAGYFVAVPRTGIAETVHVFLPSEYLALYTMFLSGLYRIASEHKFSVLLHSLGTDKLTWDKETIRHLHSAVIERAPVVFVGEAFGDVRDACTRAAALVPFAGVEWMPENGIAVVNNYEQSTADTVAYLVKKRNVRRMLAFTGRMRQYNAIHKTNGIRHAAETAGIDVTYRDTDFDAESAYNAAKELFVKNTFDAVFCGNDYEAIGVIGALTEVGRAAGRDCAVVGYGNFLDRATSYFPLTTVDQHWELMGVSSMKAVIAARSGDTRLTLSEVKADLIIGKT